MINKLLSQAVFFNNNLKKLLTLSAPSIKDYLELIVLNSKVKLTIQLLAKIQQYLRTWHHQYSDIVTVKKQTITPLSK